MTVTKLSKNWISFRCSDEIEVIEKIEFHGLKDFKMVYDSKAEEYVVIARRTSEEKEKSESQVTFENCKINF